MCDNQHSAEPHVCCSGCIVKEEVDGETLSVGLPEDGCVLECNDPSKERGTFSYISSSLTKLLSSYCEAHLVESY